MAGERVLETETPVGGEKPISVSVAKHGGEHKGGLALPPGSTVVKALEAAGFGELLVAVRKNPRHYNIRVDGEDGQSMDRVLEDGGIVLVFAEKIAGAEF